MSETSELIKCKKCRFEPPDFVLKAIEDRLKCFEELGRKGFTEFDFRPFINLRLKARIDTELAFCISTANSSAKSGLLFQKSIEELELEKVSLEKIEELMMKAGIRFWKRKAAYLKKAIEKMPEIEKILEEDARDWLVKNVEGFGYKEASHFLRNIGRKNVAILDRHILGWLNVEKVTSRRRYLEAEKKMLEIAKRTNKSVAELDLLIWYMKTGAILK